MPEHDDVLTDAKRELQDLEAKLSAIEDVIDDTYPKKHSLILSHEMKVHFDAVLHNLAELRECVQDRLKDVQARIRKREKEKK